MAGLAEGVQDVLDRFRSATLNGNPLRVTSDAGQITPPCVWVPAPDIDFQFSKRCLDVSWSAYLVAPNQSLASISPTLSDLVDAVTGLFPFTTGRPQLLTLQGGGQPVPSYLLTWSARVPIGV